jgi:DTW domain-containing protein YfiP
MVSADNFAAFREAACNGHLEVMSRLMELAPDKLQDMVSAYHFYALRQAAQNGHLAVIEKLMELAPDKIEDMVSADNFYAFRLAAYNGHLAVMEKLMELIPDKVQNMVCSDNFCAFRWAAENGHLAVIDRLMELAPDKVQDMVCSGNFYAFRCAAENGHLAVMEKLMELVPDKVQDMMSAENFQALHTVITNGYLQAVMDRLMELVPGKVQDIVSADNFYAFRWAAENGHLAVMEKLMEFIPDKVQDMVSADHFYAFRWAAENGHLVVMEKLMELLPHHIQDMVSANNFYAFRSAAENGHLVVMEKIMELAPEKLQDMISAENFQAFYNAIANAYLQIVERLLSFPAVFAHAEMVQDLIDTQLNNSAQEDADAEMFLGLVQDYIDTQLTNITQEIGDFNTNHPGQVFDITDSEKAKLYFYMLRHLIRQQTPEALNKLNLLLNIPSVRALAHQEITPNEPNELLRLAMSLNHQAAAIHLLAIPAVYNLAVRNDFYRQEQRQGLDLRTLAQNRESSMTALSQDEQNALKAVETIYQPIIDKRGVTAIMNELRDDIARRYQANPATVQTGDGREIELPLDFKDYQNLAKTLSADTRERALKSYYEDHVHTAYRYLSKPNHWMSPNAQFVNRIAEVAWSTFEGYQDLISLLYLAAKDKNTPSINEDSIEDRIHHFITELYYIGRAHNWDKTRINPSRGGVEEYDDLEGDKPSCYSGVKKRLFQSVKGHPLLLILTKDLIKQEAREMVREHFKNAINETNCEALQQAWQSVIDGNKGSRGILKQLDLSEEQVQSMLDTLHKKYGPRFDTDAQAHFLGLIQSTESSQSLAEHQGFQFHLPDILKQKAEEFQARPFSREEMVARRLRYFETQAAKNSLDETKDQEMHKKSPK